MQTRFHLWLARIISYEEHALSILNGPALKWAAVVTAFAVSLPQLASIPVVTYVWICLVLIGVDVQYIACVRQAAETTGRVRFWWIVVAVLLFLPVVQTNSIFSLHTQTGMSELDAMGMIHLTPTAWALERAFLLALLMAVSALSRPIQHTAQTATSSATSTAVMTATSPDTTPPPIPPTTPQRPTGRRTRRNIGRTVEDTEALKQRAIGPVLAMAADNQPQREIARRLDISTFMVREILRDHAQATTGKKGAA